MVLNKTYKMNNGLEIPKLELGTWFIDDDHKVSDAVKATVKIGYCHIDIAQATSERTWSWRGVRDCGIARDKIFVTSFESK